MMSLSEILGLDLDLESKFLQIEHYFGQDWYQKTVVTPNGDCTFNGHKIINLIDYTNVFFDVINFIDNDKTLDIYGNCPILDLANWKVNFYLNDELLPNVEWKARNDGGRFQKIDGIEYSWYAVGFHFQLPNIPGSKLTAKVSFIDTATQNSKGSSAKNATISPTQFGFFAKSGIPNTNASYRLHNQTVLISDQNSLEIQRKSKVNIPKLELKYLRSRWRQNIGKKAFLREAFFRTLFFLRKPLPRKPIWFLSDRSTGAGDNGEVFYNYLRSNPNCKAKLYFIIDESSPDFEKLRRSKVKVIKRGGFKQIYLGAFVEKIISSSLDLSMRIATGDKYGFYYNGLSKFDYIFLQHGITKDDMSPHLRKESINAQYVITAAQAERDSILNGDYSYNENEVLLTGFARYDNLIPLLKTSENSIKEIAVMPTWRRGILPDIFIEDTSRKYFEGFSETEYFQFYASLLTDPKLQSALQEKGYKLHFYLHPAFKNQASDFQAAAPDVEITNYPFDYRKVFQNSDLFITDFSSVYFDIAYLNKPLIYSQFDQSTFFAEHKIAKSYFDYERDGFGKVTHNLDSTIAEILELLQNDFQNPVQYQKRADKFFAFRDQKNCERIFQAIN